jgi:hypothetical protein
MSKEAIKMALEALKNSVDSVSNEAREAESLYGKYPSRLARVQGLVALEVAHQTAIKALEEALAKQEQCTYPNCDYPCTNLPDCQEQKPVKWSDYESDGVHHNKPSLAKQEQGEPDDEEVLGFNGWGFPIEPPPKQEHGEPVLWASPNTIEFVQNYHLVGTYLSRRFIEGEYTIPLYTTPQQRTWVGLTLEEILDTYGGPDGSDYVEYARGLEAKLKEKNT